MTLALRKIFPAVRVDIFACDPYGTPLRRCGAASLATLQPSQSLPRYEKNLIGGNDRGPTIASESPRPDNAEGLVGTKNARCVVLVISAEIRSLRASIRQRGFHPAPLRV